MVAKIISGEKEFEMRKYLPKQMKIGEDGFFVVEKGTNKIRCWCRVDEIRETYVNYYTAMLYATRLCVTEKYIEDYADGKKVYLWKIGKIIVLRSLIRESLNVDKNPQQFAYCPLSYGESF